jgi:hypothetical protein
MQCLRIRCSMCRYGNGAVLGRSYVDFGSSGFGSVFSHGFWVWDRVSFSPMDIQWMSKIEHFELKNSYVFINKLFI